MPASTIPQMYSVEEIASQLNISQKTVRRWVDAGQLHIHRLGRQIRITQEDLSAFLAIRRR